MMSAMHWKWLVTGLVCVSCCGAVLPAHAESKKKESTKKEATSKESVTLTGTAKAVPNKTDPNKKHLELTDKAGVVYTLFGGDLNAETVAKFDGKTVTASGKVKEKNGGKTLFVKGDLAEAK